jgi:hypothetical protein
MESITTTIMLEFNELDLAGLYTDRSGASAPITELLTLLLLAVRTPTAPKHCNIVAHCRATQRSNTCVLHPPSVLIICTIAKAGDTWRRLVFRFDSWPWLLWRSDTLPALAAAKTALHNCPDCVDTAFTRELVHWWSTAQTCGCGQTRSSAAAQVGVLVYVLWHWYSVM